jgi:hypothetical protein
MTCHRDFQASTLANDRSRQGLIRRARNGSSNSSAHRGRRRLINSPRSPDAPDDEFADVRTTSRPVPLAY